MKTDFAPPERLPKEEVLEHYRFLRNNANFVNIVNVIPEVIVILNKFRQIVFANRSFLEVLGITNIENIIGLRPGEAVGCIYSTVNEAGCGTSKFCRFCGAVKAILNSIDGKEASEECKIFTKSNRTLILRVKTSPVKIDNISYTLFTIKNIEDEKALKLYQKILFMDITEMFSEIMIASEVLRNECNASSYVEEIYNLCKKSMREITLQRLLISAENNEIKVFPVSIKTYDFLKELKEEFIKEIEIEDDTENVEMDVDVDLLRMVFENLIYYVKNFAKDDVVRVGVKKDNDEIVFTISASGTIDTHFQYSIFMKQFSSEWYQKGVNLYLAKILTEWYLNGKILFSSDENIGTTFKISLPHSISD